MLSINLASKSVQNRMTALLMDGSAKTPKQAETLVIAELEAEAKRKATSAIVKAYAFQRRIAEGVEIQAPAVLVEAVKRDKERRDYAKSIKAIVPRFFEERKDGTGFLAFRCAQAWSKNGFRAGECYARADSIDTLMNAYGLNVSND